MRLNTKNIEKRSREKKNVMINIRVTPSIGRWLKQKNYSPTGIFYEAIKTLGWKK